VQGCQIFRETMFTRIRVTSMGEFSPFRQLFSLGSFFLNDGRDLNLLGYFFPKFK
jgi:hypothetical protein